eukprot:CAMPEP_0113561780 /NCGR_PEP_ID=MMETSP0015_2-20120614/20163_1 /TAXON_ID=2838 /ORGANISM="Odontella" /LENGTH=742 /DNA_ID=CAMNT_0000463607 /DNA_START=175 /DNA_END=2406 /DNA_ORIENTATION=- /assembly_acc=CAM_ASM_000160
MDPAAEAGGAGPDYDFHVTASSGGLGASGVVADAAASAEALCRALDGAKLSDMASDLRGAASGAAGDGSKPYAVAGSGGGPVMLKTDAGKNKQLDDDSTHSSALLQEQEEEERRLTALSPEVAEFDLSNLRGIKAPDDHDDHHHKGKGKGKIRGGGHRNHHHDDRDDRHGGGYDHHHHHHDDDGRNNHHGHHHNGDNPGVTEGGFAKIPGENDTDLTNLAELVPGLRSRAGTLEEAVGLGQPLPGHVEEEIEGDAVEEDDGDRKMPASAGAASAGSVLNSHQAYSERMADARMGGRWSTEVNTSKPYIRQKQQQPHEVDNLDSMQVGRSATEDDNGNQKDGDDDDVAHALAAGLAAGLADKVAKDKEKDGDSESNESLVTRDDAEPMPCDNGVPEYGDLTGFDKKDGGNDASSSSEGSDERSSDDGKGRRSDNWRHRDRSSPKKLSAAAAENSSDGEGAHGYHHTHEGSMEPRLPPAPEPALHEYGATTSGAAGAAAAAASGAGASRSARPLPHSAQSVASLSTQTATQTHEVRMPMYLPTFKPATGCTNASDFKSDASLLASAQASLLSSMADRGGASPAFAYSMFTPTGGPYVETGAGGAVQLKKAPKTGPEHVPGGKARVEPDPLNPMFTGTHILRQKCEAANAHKSFALVFPKRTVDITAVTADQCKVLMEGFSALCFRLQVANLAGRSVTGAPGAPNEKKGSRGGKSVQSEEDRATTASVTMTNTSRADLSPGGVRG